ncbi:MAG: glycosyltransferase [Chloroflexota bacterium]|nr:MAG: glycosyltransferase [Chloroflexota bacterium]
MADPINNWVLMSFLAAPLAIISEKRYRALPAIPDETTGDALPSLSIIVPARNEAHNLPRLLDSLQAVEYPGPFELIVVDDNSCDGTARVAEQAGARVIRLACLPDGWLGKPHACHQGASAARGDWLLFTDADTVHAPDGPVRAVALAERRQLDGLSAFIRQRLSGSLDRMALMAAYAGLFFTLQPGQGVLNGQFILLKRSVYETSGGFQSVASEPIEDVALGRYLRNMGYTAPLYRSDDVAAVQMYNDRKGLWQGLSRLGSGTLSWLGPGAILTALLITGTMVPILALVGSVRRGRKLLLVAVSWVAIALGFLPWARRFGSPWLAPLAPFGALLVQAAGVWGLFGRLTGRGIQWKDRSV